MSDDLSSFFPRPVFSIFCDVCLCAVCVCRCVCVCVLHFHVQVLKRKLVTLASPKNSKRTRTGTGTRTRTRTSRLLSLSLSSLFRDGLKLLFDYLSVNECKILASCSQTLKAIAIDRPFRLTETELIDVTQAWHDCALKEVAVNCRVAWKTWSAANKLRVWALKGTAGLHRVLREIEEHMSCAVLKNMTREGVQLRVESFCCTIFVEHSFTRHGKHEIDHAFRLTVDRGQVVIRLKPCTYTAFRSAFRCQGPMHARCQEGVILKIGVCEPLWVIGQFLIDVIPAIAQESLDSIEAWMF